MVLPVTGSVRGLLGQPALCSVISPNASSPELPQHEMPVGLALPDSDHVCSPPAYLACLLHTPPLPSQGALAFRGPTGSFSGRISVHFWMYVGTAVGDGASAQVANVSLNLRSVQVAHCPSVIQSNHAHEPTEISYPYRAIPAAPHRFSAFIHRSMCPPAPTAPTIGESRIQRGILINLTIPLPEQCNILLNLIRPEGARRPYP